MKQAKIQKRIDISLKEARITTVVREAFDDSLTDGFVIALTPRWVVLHGLVDGVHLGEIIMLRRNDITSVIYRDNDAYHHRAIADLGVDIATFECDDLADTPDLLKNLAAQAEIIALHMELLDDLAIGRLVELRKKSAVLHYVGRDGVWAADLERWRYRDITRIEIGGRYLRALDKYADPEPTIAGQ